MEYSQHVLCDHALNHLSPSYHDVPISFQVPSLLTLCAHPTMLLERVRFWTWTMFSIWVVYLKTELVWSSPRRCGRLCWIMATWAVCETCSWMARVKTSGASPRRRGPWGSSLPAPKSSPNSAWATPAWTAAPAERAGTDTCATAPGPDTSADPVKEVSHL